MFSCYIIKVQAEQTLNQASIFSTSDLLKASLYFSIQPDKIRKTKIFTTFEKIHCSFIDNLKSEETKNQVKAHPSYLANFYFYNYKHSPCILPQHHVLRKLKKIRMSL